MTNINRNTSPRTGMNRAGMNELVVRGLFALIMTSLRGIRQPTETEVISRLGRSGVSRCIDKSGCWQI